MAHAAPFEPFRIKSIEHIRMTTREERAEALEKAGNNLFAIPSEMVLVDLLTDSGGAAMSDAQWGALMMGDEAYAGSKSFAKFEATVRGITGFHHVIPVHQGRAAEHILFSQIVKPGDVIPSNSHFDTTRANIMAAGGKPVDCVCECAFEAEHPCVSKGNVYLPKLRRVLDTERVPFVMCTVTNNAGGGQPVSLSDLQAVSAECRKRKIPFYLDACRFAENAWFISRNEDPRPVREIARAMFDLADGATMSCKKDGLSNTGGFFACRDEGLAEKFKQRLILVEGFPTYGGLARRDLAAIAVGLEEVLDEDYLRYRVGQVAYLAGRLHDAGVPVIQPAGGHAVFIDARAFLPHIPPPQFPGQVLAVALYLESGVRSCEIGTLMFGDGVAPPRMDLVRLAIPRRAYTNTHMDYVADHIIALHHRAAQMRGLRIVQQAAALRHFTARLEEIVPTGAKA
ncbi:MAG: tryptophanase [Planctomycetes bacterium]|nr:tryptophanase [Planctomycetota bacterium]